MNFLNRTNHTPPLNYSSYLGPGIRVDCGNTFSISLICQLLNAMVKMSSFWEEKVGNGNKLIEH